MAARLLAFTMPLLALLALACGGGGGEPGATATPEATAAPTVPEALRDFSITLERTDCFGTCPSYTVTLHGDGSVRYEGRYFVAVTGEQAASVPVGEVQRLVDKVEEIDFLALPVHTLSGPPLCAAGDAPTYSVTVSLGGTRHAIARCPGIDSPEYQALAELEDLIDEVAGTSRWIEPDAETFSITLERGPCEGDCPDYTVSIDGGGNVRYEGRSNVAVTGTLTDMIEEPALQHLMHMVRVADFFDLPELSCPAIDLPIYTTTAHLDGRTRTVSHCDWPQGSAPRELIRLEEQIDWYADTARWVEGRSSRDEG